MYIHSTSSFRQKEQGVQAYAIWADAMIAHSGHPYQKKQITTLLGKTTVWMWDLLSSQTSGDTHAKTLVIFPGFRTSSLFWDADGALGIFQSSQTSQSSRVSRICLIETNGQPNDSDGNTPKIATHDYGLWAKDVVMQLGATQENPVYIAGASFGCTVCAQLSIVAPELVAKMVWLNPGCLAPFSLSLKNLYLSLLPVIKKSKDSVVMFFEKSVFCPPNHRPSSAAWELLLQYEVLALQQWLDRAQKPVQLSIEDCQRIRTPLLLLVGDRDLLFVPEKTVSRAKREITSLVQAVLLPHVGHGSEVTSSAHPLMQQFLDAPL